MNFMNTCPCCSNLLLRHIRSHSIYWFCSHCHQEMPNLSGEIIVDRQRQKLEHLLTAQKIQPLLNRSNLSKAFV
ncbi:MAG: hypothetical protein RLZZ338_4316 [Cyanobacteriota bacterium]